MKNKRFIQAMGEIDDSLLMRYERISQRMTPKKYNRVLLFKWVSVAACFCLLFSAVFWISQESVSNYAQHNVVGREEPTEEVTEGGVIGGSVTRYKVIRPEDLASFVKNEAKNYRYYMDVELLNIFDVSFSKLSFYANYPEYSSPAFYRYCFDEAHPTAETSCFEVTVGGMTEEEFKQDKYVNIMPLETALEYEHFDESLIDNGLGIGDTYVQIGKAYYYFRPGETSRGIERIIFFVNNRIIFFSFNFDPFDLSMCYPEGDMMDNLSHLSTAPAQIDVLIALWETAYPEKSETDLEEKIAQIPSDHYESYPNQHGRPLSATLYKNGEVIEVDVNDPRLVRLINFFNDAVNKKNCAYVQSYLSWSFLESNVNHQDFRLELKYQPYGDKKPSPYGTETSLSDTIVIADDMFVLINHELTAYGNAERYPVLAAGFTPHSANEASWLDLFGF